MVGSWSAWKHFPHRRSGGNIEAPIGPGVYEVRHIETGELIAFSYSANCANALSELKVPSERGGLSRLCRREGRACDTTALEYRTFAAASRAEAKTAAQRFSGLRQTYYRRRSVAVGASNAVN